MPTRLGALAAYLIEAAWLAALVVVPAAFNVYAQRTFEADKVTLLRSLALVDSLRHVRVDQ